MKNFKNSALNLGSWTFAFILLSASFGSTTSFAVIKEISPNGSIVTLKEEAVSSVYKKSDAYNYATGKVMERWVYSPWLKTMFENGSQTIMVPEDTKKGGLLSFNFSISTSNMVMDKSYQLKFKTLYGCKSSDKSIEDACSLTFDIRCYGYVDGEWKKILDKRKAYVVSTDGSVEMNDFSFKKDQCKSAIDVSLRGTINEGGLSYTFKELDLSVSEIK